MTEAREPLLRQAAEAAIAQALRGGGVRSEPDVPCACGRVRHAQPASSCLVVGSRDAARRAGRGRGVASLELRAAVPVPGPRSGPVGFAGRVSSPDASVRSCDGSTEPNSAL